MRLMTYAIAAGLALGIGVFSAPQTAEAQNFHLRAPGVNLHIGDGHRRHYKRRHYRGRHYGYRRNRCARAADTCAYKWGHRRGKYYRCMRNYNCR